MPTPKDLGLVLLAAEFAARKPGTNVGRINVTVRAYLGKERP
jgi:hypothetical protein